MSQVRLGTFQCQKGNTDHVCSEEGESFRECFTEVVGLSQSFYENVGLEEMGIR